MSWFRFLSEDTIFSADNYPDSSFSKKDLDDWKREYLEEHGTLPGGVSMPPALWPEDWYNPDTD